VTVHVEKFGDLFGFLPKSSFKASDGRLDGPYPFFTSSSEQTKWTGEPVYSEEALVFATGGAAAVHHVTGPFATSADCLVASALRRSSVDARFVYRYLTWNINAIEAGFRGAGLRHVSKGFIQGLNIPVPPLSEQRRIAEILDKSDALRAKRCAALAQLDTLTRSIFLDMFGDPATNPKGWVQKCVGRIGTVTTGNTPPRDNPRNYGDAIEWIKSDNLNTGGYYATRASEGLSEAGITCARIAPAGAILVTCIAGSPSSIGNAAMVDRPVAFNQQINALVPEAGNPHFFFAQLTVGKRLVQQASTGGMKGLVSKGRFEKILLMEPPPNLQDRFSELALRIEAMKSGHHASLAQMEALFTALQDRAFEREL
jgi:type I restriction enzyme S subunit